MVYISEYLGKINRGKDVWNFFEKLNTQIQFKSIPFNKNEWCRDYMPVRGAVGKFVLFKYDPHYLKSSKNGQASRPDQKRICDQMDIEFEDATDIILDGGAIEIHNDTGIVSSKFLELKGNPEAARLRIKEKLRLNRLIAVPPDPWDFTGHIDGLVRFIDQKTVLVHDYTELIREQLTTNYLKKKFETWKIAFDQAINDAGFQTEILVGGFHKNRKASSAKGVYLNFLLLPELILMPTFKGLEKENNLAKEQLEFYYKREVIPIKAGEIAEEGGLINCVTWSY